MNAGLGLGALAAAAIIQVGHPGTFQAIYLLDALSFLLYAPLLLVIPARPGAAHAGIRNEGRPTVKSSATRTFSGYGH